VAAFLLPFLRPGHAKSAEAGTTGIFLGLAAGGDEVVYRDILSVDIRRGLVWSSILVLTINGPRVISGLVPQEAQAFVGAINEARIAWWNAAFTAHSEGIDAAYHFVASLSDPPRYMSRSAFRALRGQVEKGVEEVSGRWPDAVAVRPEAGMLETIRAFLEGPEAWRQKANDVYVASELVRSRELFEVIESRPLTLEQRRAVVTDDDRNLVVASAGSGKTSVIIAKAAWLIRKAYRRPDELLLLAFARDAQAEMDGRLRSRLGTGLDGGPAVRTFHSLGTAIIGEAEGKRPSLATVAEDEKAFLALLEGIVADLLADDAVSKLMAQWFQSHLVPYRPAAGFRNEGEYWDYLKSNEIRSLAGEKLKSYEECEIANFLFLHGIAYEYERPYEHDTATSDRRQYQPDFYLPQAGIYIEHFALDASGNTPPFIDKAEYVASIDWKRHLHARHGTVMIETFSHEKAAGNLIGNLTRKLADRGIPATPVNAEALTEALRAQGQVAPFVRLAGTFLRHFKGAQLGFAELEGRASQAPDRSRSRAFIDVFKPIYERYEAHLANIGQIDFDDMISRAVSHVESGRFRSPYGYILVDEFQDLSPGRARLLNALLAQRPGSQLFAVGDDWQAIFRFAGSDISYMRDFRETFGEYERVDLTTTFRCAAPIADAATKFVLANPSQIPKQVKSVLMTDGPCVHIGVPVRKRSDLLEETLRRISDDAAVHGGTATVLLLGRYRHSRPPNMKSLAQAHPGLRLTFMTIHRSKGLEADYAVVLGLDSGRYGFPTEIADDPVLDLVLAAPEMLPNAEERRLLYVAMTRARRRVFLLAGGGEPSRFVKEILGGGYEVAVFGQTPESDVRCPACVEGSLARRSGPKGSAFYGCSNYPYCRYTQLPCGHCGSGPPVRKGDVAACLDCGHQMDGCPRCNGWLVEKDGRHGRFLGCSNWPACSYTGRMPVRTEMSGTG